MKVGVVGSRTYDNYDAMCKVLSRIAITQIISGGAEGADKLGAQYARENNIELLEYLADWKRFGRSAGMIRNKDIVAASELLVAFWDGTSKGTLGSLGMAVRRGVPIVIYTPEGERDLYNEKWITQYNTIKKKEK